MIPNRDLLRLRIACRPILGLLIRGRAVHVSGPTFYVLRESLTGAFVVDPYGIDRRRMYSARISDAYRFTRTDLARRVADDLGGAFTIEPVPP